MNPVRWLSCCTQFPFTRRLCQPRSKGLEVCNRVSLLQDPGSVVDGCTRTGLLFPFPKLNPISAAAPSEELHARIHVVAKKIKEKAGILAMNICNNFVNPS